MLEAIRQLTAELVRAPALFGDVLPALWRVSRRGDSLASWLRTHATQCPTHPALITESEELGYAELFERVTRRAGWLRDAGVSAGDTVLVVGRPTAEYVCLLLACSFAGATAALASSDLSPAFLERARALSSPKLVLATEPATSLLGGAAIAYDTADFARAVLAAAPSAAREPPAGERNFAVIFTSGTTGPSKPCRITEKYALFASTVFARLVHRLRPGDRLYCCLPLHHASGLLLGLGACLVAGVPLVLRERFSARAFFDDVRRFDATVALYIGELGRALLAVPPSPRDREHPLRLLVGNGMSRVVWAGLKARFGIPEIAEFYAASEFPGSIVNLTGKLGSVGHVPFERWRGYRLARVDEDGVLTRDERGYASEPSENQPGELLLRMRGSVDGEAESSGRIARDVFRRGDVYLRSGDLLRRDTDGYFWFVDRLGDAYRFKGELVSTRDVEDRLEAEGVRGVSIVGVSIPGLEGKAGLAVAKHGDFELGPFERALASLPDFAKPRFLRLVPELRLGPSFKTQKREFARDGVDPARVHEPLFVLRDGAFEPLDSMRWQALVSGALRL